MPTDQDHLERATILDTAPPPGYRPAQITGLVLGPALATAMILFLQPADLDVAAWRTAAVGIWMAVWWMTEPVPIPATSLLPLVLFPVLGIGTMAQSASPYANRLIFLFLGGFIIALAMQRWGLHRRIALNIIAFMGTRPSAIVFGFMAASAVLSMWVSNTATTLMMLPIGLSIVRLVPAGDGGPRVPGRNFAITLMLGIAYGSSIGGMATLIGTPTNVFLVSYIEETYDYAIRFVDWMKIGVPLLIVGLPLTHVALTRLVFPIRLQELPGGRALIRSELEGLGAITSPEKKVALVFALVAAMWIGQAWVERLIPGISDTGIAIFGALLLFLIPVNFRKGEFVMNWDTAEKLPWGVLLLFGGGLSLADAVSRTGLAEWIGAQLAGVAAWPLPVLMLVVTGTIVMLTELTSNTATAAAFVPVVTALALGIGQDPLLLAVPTVLGASCAFMLPVATPPNAIVYGSGFLTIPQMARAGIVLNILFILLITLLMTTIGPPLLGIEPGVVPPWATR
jgi:sodium-dependent dicarboxylate transporter 2/3/5